MQIEPGHRFHLPIELQDMNTRSMKYKAFTAIMASR